MLISEKVAANIRILMEEKGISDDDLCYKLSLDRNPFKALSAEPFVPFEIHRNINYLAIALGINNPYVLMGDPETLRVQIAADKAEEAHRAMLRTVEKRKPRGWVMRFFRGLIANTLHGVGR